MAETLLEKIMNRFGLEINKDRNMAADKKLPQFSPPENEDGAIPITSGALENNFTYQIALDAQVASESELINQYRQVALFTECDMAVEEICNESIVQDDERSAVEIVLDGIDNTEVPEATKKEITAEFEEILRMLNFNEKGFDIFRRWYIDSRIAYQKMVDPKKPREGIKKLKFLDPRKIRKVREVEAKVDELNVITYEVTDEYFVYFEAPYQYDKTYGGGTNVTLNRMNRDEFLSNTALKINKDAIAYIPSGLIDPSTGITYGYLQKALRPFNQLRWAEDSMIVKRIANSSEKRIIYVDIGRMNPKNAERYLQNLQQQYKNRMSYDAVTGNVKSDARVMSVQENIWLPRIDGNKTTEIDTLQSNVNFSDIDDIEYFKEKLWNSLRVPPARFKSDGIQMVLGQQNEISREELKFMKFINRLRKQFAHLFDDLLKSQLILKGIMTEEEWDEVSEKIQYNFIRDSYYTEAKEQELLMSRIEAFTAAKDLIGLYISNDYARKKILRQTEEEIEEEDKKIEEEKKSNKYSLDTDEEGNTTSPWHE